MDRVYSLLQHNQNKRVFLVFFLTIAFFSFAAAQENQFARHHQDSKTGDIVCINSKCFHLEISNPDDNYGYQLVSLVGTSSTGTELFRIPIFGRYQLVNYFLIATPSKELLVYTSFLLNNCDVGPENHVLVMVDTSGNGVFDLSGSVFKDLVGAVGANDGNVYAVTSTNILVISSVGHILSNTSMSITGIQSISHLANGRFMLNYKQGALYKNRILDSALHFINETNACNSLRKVKRISSGAYLALGGNDLVKMRGNWNCISSSQSILPSGATDYDLRNDSIFITGHNNEIPYLMVTDTSFNIIYQSNSTCSAVIPSGISMNNKANVIASTNKISGGGIVASYPTLFKMNPGLNFSPKYDIGVENVTVNKLSVKDYTNTFFSGRVRTFTSDLTVILKNFGADTIKTFTLKYNAGDGYFNCYGNWSLYWEINTPIAPYSSIVVNTGTFYSQVIIFKEGQPQTFCLFTTVPNEKIDEQQDNDEFCLTVPVGIEELINNERYLSVSPNPFQSLITVTSSFESCELELSNSEGRLIAKRKIDGHNTTLDLGSLPPGLYFINATEKEKAIHKKLIKLDR
jgi:hypothetical protein